MLVSMKMQHVVVILRINDVIVSVNKISMVNIPHMTAVEVLKNAGNTVTFVSAYVSRG